MAQNPLSVFDASSRALGAQHRYRVHIELDATFNGIKQRTTYNVAVDGKTALLRIRQPAQAGMGRSDRTFAIGESRLTAYDALANERLSRPLSKSDSLLARVTAVIGKPDDMLGNVIDPSGMSTFFAALKRAKGWRLRRDPNVYVVSREYGSGAAFSRTVLRFDLATSFLRSIYAVTGKNEIRWMFEFSLGGSTSYAPPAGARLVSAFTVAPAPPKYKNATAKRTTERMIAANRDLTRGEIEVSDDDGSGRILLDGRKVREDRGLFSYAYDGKILAIVDRKTHTFYRGAVVRSTVPDYVAAVGGRVDVVSRQIFGHRIPFQEVLEPGLTVSVTGQAARAGPLCDIVEMTKPGTRMSFFIRKDNHLVDSVTTETLDNRGRMLTSSSRRFDYTRLGVALPDTLFHLNPAVGQRVLPMPKDVRLTPGM